MGKPERGKVHVLTVIDHPAGGGAERLATEVLLRLDQREYKRTFCVSRWGANGHSPQRDRMRRALEAAGVDLLPLDRKSSGWLRGWAPLVVMLRRERVDVLHAHKFGSNVWGCLLGRLTGVPVVVAHEHTWSYEGQPLRRALDRHLISRLADVFVAVSLEDRRRMVEIEGIAPKRIEVVTNGIWMPPPARDRDVRAELDIARDAPVLGAVAALRPQKGLDVLVRAASLLTERHPDLRVLLVGSGSSVERARLGALVEELQLGDVVRFLGSREDMPEILAALDVAVSSSRFEGSPLAIMEYMAAGLPIVATRVGGVPDLIEDGRHGLLVDPDDPRSLADAADRLLSDRRLGSQLAEAARLRQVAEFDVGVTVQRISDLYQRLLSRKGHGLRVEPLTEGIEALEPWWQELAQASGSPFLTHEWVDAWWRWFGDGRRLRLLGCRRRDDSLAAILPLYEDRVGPLRVMRFLGHGTGAWQGPVCHPRERPAALAALRHALRAGSLRTDLLLAEHLPVQGGGDRAFGGAFLDQEAIAGLRVESLNWESFLADCSPDFRDQLRQREPAFSQSHTLRYRLADDPRRLDDDLSTLFALHEAVSGPGGGVFGGARGGFHRDFAAVALARGWLRLWLLEADGEPMAAWYGFRFGAQEWYYGSGHDPSWDGHSAGFLLLSHTIRCAMEDGVHVYRLLEGDEANKGWFPTHDQLFETRAAAHGPLGHAALAAMSAAKAGPDALQKRVRRLAG